MWQYETNDKMQKVRGYKAKIIMNMSFFISKMLRQNSFSLLKHKDTCNCKICIQSQQNSAVTRMWRSCQAQPSQKERAHKKNVRFVVKRKGCCCNLSVGVALNVWFTMNRMCVKKNI